MKTALIQILKYQKLSSGLNKIANEHAFCSFVTALGRLWFSKLLLDTCINKRFLKITIALMYMWVWIYFKANVCQFYVITVRLKEMSNNNELSELLLQNLQS